MKLQASKNVSTVIFAVLMMAAFGAALALRLPRLDERPMHTDEACHTEKFAILYEQGQYEYDPSDFHGPTIYYFAMPVVWLSGAQNLAQTNETMFRIVIVAFGVALILILLLVYDALGPFPIAVAALLTAVSPAMSFYSRYYIQEIPFIFFTFGVIGCAWRYSRAFHPAWLIAAGVFIGLMQATKETSVLAYAAMAAGLALIMYSNHRENMPITGGVKTNHVVMAVIAAVFVCALFITGHFTNPPAMIDAVTTYFSYLKRADGVGMHEQPWYYYLRMMLYTKFAAGPWWSEGFIVVLAAAGIVAATIKKEIAGANIRFIRFIAVYTVALTLIYAMIPYKTPWCMLGFLHGMILLAGVGAVEIIRALKWRIPQAAAVVLIAFGLWHMTEQSKRANSTLYHADTRNPYVYGHTSTNFMRLANRFEQLAQVSPKGKDMLVKVMTPDQWPLPWYLRDFNRVGYWIEPTDNPHADVVVTSIELENRFDEEFRSQYKTETYGLRPEVLIRVFIRQELWDKFIERQMTDPL